MRIKNIKITNFRNLQNVNLELKNINVLTGRNASGKTNFLNAIAHSLEIKEQLGAEFNNNITTKGGRGKSATKISVVVENIVPVCIISGDDQKKDSRTYLPNTVTYTNTIGGTDYNSHKQEFKYHGVIEMGPVTFPLKINKKSKKDRFELLNTFQTVAPVERQGENSDSPGQNFNPSIFTNNKILQNDFARYFFDSNKKNPLHKFIKRLENGVYLNEISSKAIIDYVLAVPSGELYEQIIKRIKQEAPLFRSGDFSNASFGALLADIQCHEETKNSFYRDLNAYTRGLIRSIYIQSNSSINNSNEKIGNEGMILVETPNAPKWLSSISAGSAVMIFFLTLKNWLSLPRKGQSYSAPSVMLFDEIDSSIHPSLIKGFIEVLRSISSKVQLILTSHSSIFIDQFSRDEIYYIKPNEDIGNIKHNRSDILSYKQILSKITQSDAKEFENVDNSELFINGMIDDLYPNG